MPLAADISPTFMQKRFRGNLFWSYLWKTSKNAVEILWEV